MDFEPEAWLTAYAAAEESERQRALATLLQDAIRREPARWVSLLEELRSLRTAKPDARANTAIAKAVVGLEVHAGKLDHELGLAALTEADRARIAGTLEQIEEIEEIVLDPEPTKARFRDRYTYLDRRPAGKGGFGEVYRMRQLATGDEVAVKYLLDEHGQSAELVARFHQEAKAMRAVQEAGGHPNLLGFVEAGSAGSRAYLVTPWAKAGTLFQQLKLYGGQVPLELATRWMREALAGLGWLHERGWIHRDIKPSNLYLSAGDGPLWIGDFGLAMQPGEPRLTRQHQGSPGTEGYSPMEQFLGHDQDARTDLYSWAATAYTMLTGAVCPGPGASAKAGRGEVNAGWDSVITACLSDRMGGRPGSVGEVLGVLAT